MLNKNKITQTHLLPLIRRKHPNYCRHYKYYSAVIGQTTVSVCLTLALPHVMLSVFMLILVACCCTYSVNCTRPRGVTALTTLLIIATPDAVIQLSPSLQTCVVSRPMSYSVTSTHPNSSLTVETAARCGMVLWSLDSSL